MCLHMKQHAPEVFHEAVDVVGLRQGDLEAHSSGDIAGQAGKTLLARPADADEQGRTPWHLDKAVEPQEMSQSIVEQHQFKLVLCGVGGGRAGRSRGRALSVMMNFEFVCCTQVGRKGSFRQRIGIGPTRTNVVEWSLGWWERFKWKYDVIN